jgi:sulfite dehydrogenase
MRGTGGRDGLYALWIAVVAIGWGSVGTAWAADPATPAELARGKQLFVSVQPACAVCHTLQAAGAQGEVGPVLDEIKPNADRVLRALRNGIGAMPSFAEKMTEQDMQAVARFVAQSTGAAP